MESYVNDFHRQTPRRAAIKQKALARLDIQCDEMWTFLDSKDNQMWIWLAMDAESREIISCVVGDRSKNTARRLWNSFPTECRQCAVMYTDSWKPYEGVFSLKRYIIFDKKLGKTNYIEQFNCTLRWQCSRLIHKTLSFGQGLENLVGSIWHFIHNYNAKIQYV